MRLSMQDYPSYGILTMEDRLKLFKLIQIVKSVQSEGMTCHHSGSNVAHVPEDSKANLNSKIKHQQTNIPQDNQLQNGVNLRRSKSMRLLRGPSVHAQQRGRSTRSGNVERAPKRASSNTRVEYKPNSDSPIFHCRRKLKFSDSDLESEANEEDNELLQLIKAKRNKRMLQAQKEKSQKQKQVSCASSSKESIHVNADFDRLAKTQDLSSKLGSHLMQSYSQNSKLSSMPLRVVNEPKVRAFNVVNDTKKENIATELPQNRIQVNTQSTTMSSLQKNGQPVISDERRARSNSRTVSTSSSASAHYKPASSDSNSLSSQKIMSSGFIEKKSSVHPVSKQVLAASDVRMQRNNNNNTQTATSQQSSVPSISKESSRGSRDPVLFIENTRSPIRAKVITPPESLSPRPKTHSPRASPPNPKSKAGHSSASDASVKAMEVNRVYHNAFNYGVPTADLPQQPLPDLGEELLPAKMREGRIRVCARKRPLLSNEVSHGECDVIRVEDGRRLAVEEVRTAVDLSRFMQQASA